ncbi:MAG: hypothetical protein B7Z74_01860, partial [Deltaproteobacteria bacterium 21-66-5]
DAREYIPVADRAPCVRYNLCRMVVEDAVSLLFGDGHFPGVQIDDEATRDALSDLIAETRLAETMQDAAVRGSIGSVAIRLIVLRQRVFFDVFDTLYLTPEYDPEEPDRLIRIVERYKVKGRDLAAKGYVIPEDALATDHWFRREWDINNERWFVPQTVADAAAGKPPRIDAGRSVTHQLGFCPWVWIKNLGAGRDKIDGPSTFAAAVESQIEIEYQLSLGGRALKYSASPTLMLKEPSGTGTVALAAGDTIIVSEKGDGKWLEIDGGASEAVREHVRLLREFALESIHGNRSNADKVSAAQSGRALELLHQPLIWLADKLRLSYGEGGLLPLLRMVVEAARKYPLKVNGKAVRLAVDQPMTLAWPRWFPPTAADRSSDATTLVALTSHGLMSQETALRQIAPVYDVADPGAEASAIATDQAKADQRAAAQAAQITAATSVESSA